jgi:hypothetical protein
MNLNIHSSALGQHWKEYLHLFAMEYRSLKEDNVLIDVIRA